MKTHDSLSVLYTSGRAFKLSLLAFALIGSAKLALSADYYVSAAAAGPGTGTLADPFATIQQAADIMVAGDTCYMRGGTYREAVTASNLNGSSSAPITFTNYNDEVVTFDGTLTIAELGSTGWTQHQGSIYKTTLTTDTWQLFFDGAMMIPARWPNANFDDGSIWNQSNWARGHDSRSSNGSERDRPQNGNNLAGSGLDMTGAVAVLNLGSWRTRSRIVSSHSAGARTFQYTPDFENYLAKDHHYYMECKLNLLDVEKEWFYDTDTKELYLWAPGGGVPSGEIRGKVQDYAFSISDSDYVVLDGLDFYGTTVSFTDSPYTTVQNCDFLYPSVAKRMLGITGVQPDVTQIWQPSRTTVSHSAVLNCTFKYAEGEAVRMQGRYDRIENCLFEYIDWSASDLGGLMAGIYMAGDDNTFRRNTTRVFGASQMLEVRGFGADSVFLGELNDCSEYSLLQADGAAFQVTRPVQPDSIFRYNWIYNAPDNGIRFDAPVPPTVWGQDGTVYNNVSWNCSRGFMIKGQDHFVYNNTSWDSTDNDIIILDEPGFVGTTTRNNAADSISGSSTGSSTIPGIADYNWNGFVESGSVTAQLRDPAAFDFRPSASSDLIDAGTPVAGVTDGYLGAAPDQGAYEFGAANYWIPGRKIAVASRPIPADGAVNQLGDRDLIWLGGYQGTAYDVYFGSSESEVENATTASPEYQGQQSNNIFVPSDPESQATRYWRIDTVTSDGTVKGEVWSYSYTTLASNLPIQSGLLLHFAADQITGLSSGDPVDQWGNLAVASNHGTASGSERPSYITAALAGKPVVRFDGDDDWLNVGTLRTATGAMDLFLVAQSSDVADGSNQRMISAYDTGANDFAAPNWMLLRDRVSSSDGTPVVMAPRVMTFSRSSGVHIAGVKLARRGDSSSNYLGGDIAEVILFDRQLRDWERNAIGHYLETKYALASGTYIDPEQDSDQDGSDNEDELIAGTDPDDSQSVFRLNVGQVGGDLQLGWDTVAGRSYLLERSYDLLIWDEVGTFSGQYTEMLDEATILDYPKAFYRVSITDSE